ncbi:murein hydrolase activator EnvC [Cypionkella sp.]|uniref:murein hydrolase activator EnvC family protein n=1 Tax=Cypionkella sp. TaxID=2811411 RepID=UPI00271EC9D4|nr:peptidoglycan DD-metalloendopeptidase family protein [Cypionkella sp.]MDO8985275.1 peptidoglycan DD-metalloendopeptidase family protein [Cypionkella sp.]MDP2051761.1 peptidoglycan DD-metalloendopeptidase family protein [Cypionkella sp.]
MIRPVALTAALLLMWSASAASSGVAEDAAEASAELQQAVAALQAAEGAKDRVAALTQTIKAYEEGLAALREALRQAELRETALTLQFQTKRDRIAQLLGVLSRIDAEPGPLLLLHPTGPLGTVRSGMMLADVTPALQAEVNDLKGQLQELSDLRRLQKAAGETLGQGLAAAQTARSDLSQAMSDRTKLPKRFTEDPDVLRGLLESADTLEAFAAGLALDDTGNASFADQQGKLDLPALGTLLLRTDETDMRGVTRPGMTLATRPAALVTSPWAATIRYRGPLLDYGNVMIIEPGGGYLMVLGGLDQVYGEVGEVIPKGAALGLMGGAAAGSGDLLAPSTEGSGGRETETLYIELRQGAKPVDPMQWFAATAKAEE